jgi:NADH dehydrogenase FAD-containing subunit
MNPPDARKPRVVIVGGGFGGLAATKTPSQNTRPSRSY